MAEKIKTTKDVIRVEGRLNKIITIRDETGKIIHKIVSPLMVEFRPKDVLQVIVGATLLAIPVGYTEETWNLGEALPLFNVLGFLILSLIFISAFVYYNYYREKMKEHWDEFLKRIFSTASSSGVLVFFSELIERL